MAIPTISCCLLPPSPSPAVEFHQSDYLLLWQSSANSHGAIMVMVLLQTIANSNYAIVGDGIVLFTVL